MIKVFMFYVTMPLKNDFKSTHLLPNCLILINNYNNITASLTEPGIIPVGTLESLDQCTWLPWGTRPPTTYPSYQGRYQLQVICSTLYKKPFKWVFAFFFTRVSVNLILFAVL